MDNTDSDRGKTRLNIKSFIIILVQSTILSIILVVIIKIPIITEVLLEILFPKNPIIIFPYNLIGLLLLVLGFAFSIVLLVIQSCDTSNPLTIIPELMKSSMVLFLSPIMMKWFW